MRRYRIIQRVFSYGLVYVVQSSFPNIASSETWSDIPGAGYEKKEEAEKTKKYFEEDDRRRLEQPIFEIVIE